MFNMESIGRKISELRKQKNMTQMELADKMNISFQAVSNWERGNSMPDISKLPELAKILGVSIDELLGTESELIENIVNDRTEEYLKGNQVSPEEFSAIAPILKPEQVDTIVANANPPFELSDIVELLPFISRNIIDQIAMRAFESGDYRYLHRIAPFISREIINDMAKKMADEDKIIDAILPFVSRDVIGELAVKSYQKKGLSALSKFLPFIPKDVLKSIAEREFETRGLRYLDTIAPFLSREYLNELAKRAIEKDGIKAIVPIAPFLDKEILSEYIKEKYL